MSTPQHILAVFSVLSARWPAQAVTEKTIELYSACLSDVEPDALKAAALVACRSDTFFPGPNRLLELVRVASGELSAEEAWTWVRDRVVSRGHNRPPSEYPNEQTARGVAALGGWAAVCSSTCDQGPANRAHFMRTYEAFKRSDRVRGDFAAITDGMARGSPMLSGFRQLYGADYHDPDDARDPNMPGGEPRRNWKDEVDPPQVDDLDS